MALTTSSHRGNSSTRIVLLKDYNEKGFIFSTNLMRRKA